jgi:outer membrane protein TolC
LILGFIFPGFYLKAQKSESLILSSLDYALNLGIQSNPSYAVYKEQTQVALYNLRTARSTWMPSLSGTLSGQDNTHLAVTPIPGILLGKPGTTYNAQFGAKYNYVAGLILQKDLLSWQNYLQIKLAGGNLKLTEVQSEAYLQSLKEQIVKLYFSVLVSKYSLSLGEENRKIADTLVNLSKLKLDQGSSDAINYNLSQINLNTVIQNLAQSQELLDQATENLKILLGEKGNRELILSENLTMDSAKYLGNSPLQNDKNLETYKQEVFISDIQSKIQKSAFLPRLSFQTYLGATQFRNDFGFSIHSNNWSKTSYLGLSLSIPFFTGFGTLNKYRSSMSQFSISKIQYEAAIHQSQINDELILKADRDLLHMVNASKTGYLLYKNNIGLNKLKFNEGLISLDIYLKSFQDYINSENVFLNNLSNYFSNKATLISRQ